MIFSLIAATTNEIFGKVEVPAPIAAFGGGEAGGGLIIFISNMVKVISVVAGLFAFFNIIGAGYTYLSSSGNPKATEQAMNQLFMSLIGMIIIVGSFTITAIVSLLLFGRADYILNPSIPSAVSP